MKIQLTHTYNDIISIENLLLAWQEFVAGKRTKPDVSAFGRNVLDNIIILHKDLASERYRHGPYHRFSICDPKPRIIHKAGVRDRLLHHAIYRILYPFFDRTFIADSFACRKEKGVHRALGRFRSFAHIVSKNHTRTCGVLKCDIRKFFASIDQAVLLRILAEYIPDPKIMGLLRQMTSSFYVAVPGRGLPLGNLTSQLFVNVYMNVFDQFVKHKLKVRHYIRYADDFVLLSPDRDWLLLQLPRMKKFLRERLHLTMHPNKIMLQTFASGVDLLGWVHFPDHRILRTATERRMMRRIRNNLTEATVQSYLGLLRHGNTQKLKKEVLHIAWLWGGG